MMPTKNATAVRHAWATRIQQLHDLLIHAIVGEDPPQRWDSRAGMVVTVRYDATGDTDTFLLGVHSAEYADMAVYSIQSPPLAPRSQAHAPVNVAPTNCPMVPPWPSRCSKQCPTAFTPRTRTGPERAEDRKASPKKDHAQKQLRGSHVSLTNPFSSPRMTH